MGTGLDVWEMVELYEDGHAGLVLIPRSIKLDNFGAIISGIREVVSEHSQEEWVDRVEWMKKGH